MKKNQIFEKRNSKLAAAINFFVKIDKKCAVVTMRTDLV